MFFPYCEAMIGKIFKKNKLASTFDGFGSVYGDYWLQLWISATTMSFTKFIKRVQCRSILRTSNIYSLIYKQCLYFNRFFN